MKRIIKFRGKDCLTGEWVYGYYTTAKTRDPETGEKTIKHIIHADDGLHDVDENTVGQYTGLSDKKGNEIYEDDIIKKHDPYNVMTSDYVGHVKWYKCRWTVLNFQYGFWNHSDLVFDDFANIKQKVIGNIHDNPELLKGGEE